MKSSSSTKTKSISLVIYFLTLTFVFAHPALALQAAISKDFDTSGDGRLSLEEFLGSMPALFERADQDHNGYLSTSESSVEGEGTEDKRMVLWLGQARFARIDADNDGRLSLDEVTVGEEIETIFFRVDRNADRYLNPHELEGIILGKYLLEEN